MEAERISVLYKHPDQAPKLVIIPNTLEALQTLVGGYIEEGTMFWGNSGQPFVVFCDEEGKIKRKPDNLFIEYDWTFEIIVGDVVVARIEQDELEDMTPDDFEDALEWLEAAR